MREHKTLFKIALALVAAMSVALACRQSPQDSVGSVGKVVIQHWDWFTSQGKTIDRVIAEFERDHPHIHIKRTTVQSARFPDLFNLSQKAGKGPDIFLIPSAPVVRDFVANQWLLPFNQLEGYPDFAKTFPTHAFAEGSNVFGGQTYTVPMNGPLPWVFLWINTKVFREAGLVDARGEVLVPKTLEDFVAACRKIHKASGGKVHGYGYGNKDATSSNWHWWLAQFSGLDMELRGLNLKTGRYEYHKHPPFTKLLETFAKLQREQLLLPQGLSIDDETARVFFAQGKFGMYLGGSWVLGGWKETNPEFKDYLPASMLLIDAPKPKSFFCYGPGGYSFGINAQTRHPNEVWLWYQRLLSPGTGKAWVRDGNGGSSIFPEANQPGNITDPALARTFQMSGLMRVSPQPALRNPDAAKVKIPSVRPDEGGLFAGILTGQIKDIPAALKALDERHQAALEQAIDDAVASGAKVSLKDWIFPHYDPSKDYR